MAAPALLCSVPGTRARQGQGEERVRDVPASCHKAFADLSRKISQEGEVAGSVQRLLCCARCSAWGRGCGCSDK